MADKNQPGRILFVDDEPAIRAMLPVILRRSGFNVRVAASVLEAQREIETHKFDLLLCDLNIHKTGDGYHVVRAIRKINPRCITVILTAYPSFDTALEGIHYGVDDYVCKPSNADQLVALLAEKLESRRTKALILSVSYHEPLALTRQLLLEREGYQVISAMSLGVSLEYCRQDSFDLLILDQNIPRSEKGRIVESFRCAGSAPIISLRATLAEEPVSGADFHVDSDPQALLNVIAALFGAKFTPGLPN